MQCPHCRVQIHPTFDTTQLGVGRNVPIGEINNTPTLWTVSHMACPGCKEAILRLSFRFEGSASAERDMRFIYPSAMIRPRAPQEVPRDLADDFNEACLVLSNSPKASAALSRRCLQAMLRDNGFTQKDLAPAIDAALASKQLPSAIAENLDAVRNIGNFAAHPMKDTNSGLITSVEPEEAEWNLDVLEELFDFFYVQPEKAKLKRAALDAKLAAAGKPPMKK